MRCFLVMSLCTASVLSACAPEGNSAYVSANVPVDSDCKADPGSSEFIAVGVYDVAPGGDWNSDDPSSTSCRKSYFMHLVVNSSLKANANVATGRAEPNVLQVTEAEVRLIDIEQQATIVFDARSTTLPNPFRVKTTATLRPSTGRDPSTATVAVEAIPVGYDSQLRSYKGSQILAEVQMFGTTTGDVDIDFKPFSFPIRICEGCLTLCKGDIPDDADISDIIGDECFDNAGADGRVCIDDDC